MITGESLERAERSLIQAREFVPEDRILFERAFTDKAAVERFLRHHLDTLQERHPELDPRLEPALATMFRHMLLVGAVAGRQDVLPE